MIEQKNLTRQQMHDLVWTTPMIQLAKEFQLSDNGLRKICRKYLIPVPKGGYWQKIRYGKTVKKIDLPPYKGENAIVINIIPRIERPVPSKILTETIAVPDRIKKFHPLVTKTRKQFSRIRKGDNSVIFNGLEIRVQNQVSRACRIMDTIIKALEERGAKVFIDRQDQWKRFTHAVIDGEKVHFGLRECLKIEKIEPDPKSLWGSTQKFVPSGRLELYISDYLGGLRTKWKDHEEGRLEEKLTSFINGLWVAAAHLKKRRQDREDEDRRQNEARQEQEKKIKELEEEKLRIQTLENQSASWQKSRTLRTFIRSAVKKQGSYLPDSDFAKWVSWASSHADRLDPLK